MSKISILLAASLVALAGGVHAADDPATAAKKSSLAASANTQLRQADVPSVRTDPNGAQSVKAQADADMAARAARDKGPRLVVKRENLKGNQAARAMEQRANPNTIDHDIAYGDKDHTEQVTDIKVQLKK
ncbi:hypothetical protein [Scleromatobacter humisilvae]|uniref:DUF4148 domain-containing protein n=1 Tax=Scleromatobacter humisilvae TaxID=2897159 RepID=A0A9X1YEY3_9BURK|nr:hypothetical protein [Scleromatobacter humisilvae]MCK9685239.1 hypothetical protein [Scleromatobacter humisilvae]